MTLHSKIPQHAFPKNLFLQSNKTAEKINNLKPLPNIQSLVKFPMTVYCLFVLI